MKLGIVIFVVLIIGIIGFFSFSGDKQTNTNTDQNTNKISGNINIIDWKEYELTDINTGKTFKISDFKGTPILLESFAVWCPTCTKQQNIVKKLHEEPGFSEEELISISIDTDPSEDEQRIRDHIESNGFTWYYAISPIELTQSLINEFGNSIISAPSVPMILICEDGSFRKLGGFGSRSVDKLKSEIAKGC